MMDVKQLGLGLLNLGVSAALVGIGAAGVTILALGGDMSKKETWVAAGAAALGSMVGHCRKNPFVKKIISEDTETTTATTTTTTSHEGPANPTQ